MHSDFRRVGRRIRHFSAVPRERLDDITKKRFDHHMLVAADISRAMSMQRNNSVSIWLR